MPTRNKTQLRRILYLFCLGLLVGMVMVHLRTQHYKAVNQMALGAEKQQQLRRQLEEQQTRLSEALESPEEVSERVEELQVSVLPPGKEQTGLAEETLTTN